MLSHEANKTVLHIRRLEVNYYATLYAVFGTQGVLVGGFVYNMFSQNNIRPDNVGVEEIKYVYFISSAITMAISLHILVTTMLLQGYGPGLAIHGPLGSMARAAEGLRAEQAHVVKAFVLMIVFFSLSTISVFWLVSKLHTAIVSTVMYLIVLRQSYYYCERIYLRFYWNGAEKDWNDGREREVSEDDDEPGAVRSPLAGAVGAAMGAAVGLARRDDVLGTELGSESGDTIQTGSRKEGGVPVPFS